MQAWHAALLHAVCLLPFHVAAQAMCPCTACAPAPLIQPNRLCVCLCASCLLSVIQLNCLLEVQYQSEVSDRGIADFLFRDVLSTPFGQHQSPLALGNWHNLASPHAPGAAILALAPIPAAVAAVVVPHAQEGAGKVPGLALAAVVKHLVEDQRQLQHTHSIT